MTGLTGRRGFGSLFAALPALAACAQFPDLANGSGASIEADPLFQEAAASAPVLPGNQVGLLFGGSQAFTALFDASTSERPSSVIRDGLAAASGL